MFRHSLVAAAVTALLLLLAFFKNDFSKKQTTDPLRLSAAQEHYEAALYDYERMRNPLTGKLPHNFRNREIAFAQTLPVANNSRSSQWQNRGPINLGGRTRALGMDVMNENILIAGQVSGGMWRSTDGGANWVKTTAPGQTHSTSCVAQDTRPGHTNVWYAGTGEQYGIVSHASFSSQYSGNGIFKSTDNGLTWTQLPSTMSNTPTTWLAKRDMDFVWEIVTDPSNSDSAEVYAATVNGIWRSVDGGNSWSTVLGLDTAVVGLSEYTDIAITDSGVLYATISSQTPSKGIWRSTDGINWTNITPNGFAGTYYRVEIGIAPSDQNRVYFIAEAPGSGTTGHQLWHYTYLSGNGSGAGGQWSNRTANIPDENCTGFFEFDFRKFNSQTSYDLYVVVHPSNPDIVFLGGTNIYRSTDGFTTPAYEWVGGYQCDTSNLYNYVYPNHHSDQHELIFLPSNNQIAISAGDGGIFKTQNIMSTPVVWQTLYHNYRTGQFYTCNIEQDATNDIVIGGLQDNGTYFTPTSNPDAPWAHTLYGDGSYIGIPHGHPFYVLSWQTGKTYKCFTDTDGNMLQFTRIDPSGATGHLFINPFILDPSNDSIIYYAGGRSVYRQDDVFAIPMMNDIYNTISTGWTKLNGSTVGIGISSPRVTALDMSKSHNNILYYGTSSTAVYRLDSCRTNNAAQKVNISGPDFPAGGYVSCVDVDDHDYRKVLVTFSNYGVKSIFYTSDAGATWTHVSGNLEQHPDGTGDGPAVFWINALHFDGATTYYAATSTGLYSTSTLNGDNTVWSQEGANTIGNVVVNMIASRSSDGMVVIATHGNSIYSNKIVSSIRERSEEKLSLSPNPFSSAAKISWSGAGEAEIRITNMAGQLVFQQKTGEGHLIWNGTNRSGAICPAGLYTIHVNCKSKFFSGQLLKQ